MTIPSTAAHVTPRRRLVVLAVIAVTAASVAPGVLAPVDVAIAAGPLATTDLAVPAGSGAFGTVAMTLANGNIIVTDPSFDDGSTADVGAVYLYDGTTLALISRVTGSTAGDSIGSGGVVAVGGSSAVVVSPSWDGAQSDSGAVTFVDGELGLSGTVLSASNSLVGNESGDLVGPSVITPLRNGNYVVSAQTTGVPAHGMFTLGNGETGITGAMSAATSLVGTQVADGAESRIVELTNGNYVVVLPHWNLGAGAVAWADGSQPTVGTISAANSIVGADVSFWVSAVALADGSYTVAFPSFDSPTSIDIGAVTWAAGTQPTGRVVSTTNSVVGSTGGDSIGESSVVALTNGNYVVLSRPWTNGLNGWAGAATWVQGGAVRSFAVTSANSLVGTAVYDANQIGATALSNGNFVVTLPYWDNGAVEDVGAVAWGDGATGAVGPLTSTNSLVGTVDDDRIGLYGITVLPSGDYLVRSPLADIGLQNSGALTFGDGARGVTGAVSMTNSLVGGLGDQMGSGEVTVLTSGDYVAALLAWNGNRGLVTMGSGTAPTAGLVSAANSLVGSSPGDGVGTTVTALDDGNFVVGSPYWDNGTIRNVGAATWVNGTTGLVGSVSPANSLVGTYASDGDLAAVVALPGGRYAYSAPFADSPSAADVGAVSVQRGGTSISGAITIANAVFGASAGDTIGYDQLGHRVPIEALSTDVYAFSSPGVDDGSVVDAGAVTVIGPGLPLGPISPDNSLFGRLSGSGSTLAHDHSLTPNGGLAVSQGTDNRVTLALVADVEAPVIDPASVPAGTAVVTAPGATAAVVTYTPPSATDGRGGPVTVQCTPPPGSTFAVGSTIVTCTATDESGNVATTSFKVTVAGTPAPMPPGPRAPDFVPVGPARLADTRPRSTTVDDVGAGGGPIPAGGTLQIAVARRGGVPADAVAFALNITAVDAGGDGFVTAYPCGTARPAASTLNVSAGAIVPNAAVVRAGSDGAVCVYSSVSTDVVVDVHGYFPAGSAYRPLDPTRVLDTRPGQLTVDAAQQGGGPNMAATVTELAITGRAGVPVDASAVVLNITATDAQAEGFVTVYPCGSTRPTASTLNLGPGRTIANLAIAQIGPGGSVCIYTQQTVHLVADVSGWFPAGTDLHSVVPARLLDTRSAAAPARGAVTRVHVLGAGGVPTDARTVVLNVTATDAEGSGFVTVFPCGAPRPLASSLNVVPGGIVANAVVAAAGTDGDVCIYTSQSMHLVVDVTASFAR